MIKNCPVNIPAPTQVPPQIFPFSFGDEPLNTGESIGVQCMINKGDLPIDIRWIINSAPIISGENSYTSTKLNSRTSSLNIEYLDAIHRGVYKCVASNKAGSVEHSAVLNINGYFDYEFRLCFYDLYPHLSARISLTNNLTK